MPQIDPTLYLIAGAFGASIVGLMGGVVGAWIQSRREHSRWVRELREKAYRELLSVIGLNRLTEDGRRDSNSEADRRTSEALAAIRLVGPNSVEEAATRYVEMYDEMRRTTIKGGPNLTAEKARKMTGIVREFQIASRRALGIRVERR